MLGIILQGRIYDNLFFCFAGGKKFSPVTTDLPVFASNSLRAFLATLPPFYLLMHFRKILLPGRFRQSVV